jgi:CheY-like chemotaxis protein
LSNKNKASIVSNNNRILIVDDDIFSVFSLKTILQEIFGLESDQAYSGADGIKSIQKKNSLMHRESSLFSQGNICSPHYYKLIFMDLNMPEMNGIEATQVLKNLT